MSLTRFYVVFLAAPLLFTQLSRAQAPAPAPPPADPNMQFVDEILRTATAVRSLIQTMNLDKVLGTQAVYPPGDPRSLQRTAEFIGVGAGVGMALGELAHSQKGALIGAAAGSAGGLVVDQLLRHQAAKRQNSPPGGNPELPHPDDARR